MVLTAVGLLTSSSLMASGSVMIGLDGNSSTRRIVVTVVLACEASRVGTLLGIPRVAHRADGQRVSVIARDDLLGAVCVRHKLGAEVQAVRWWLQ
jgi:hypothetical protein